MSTQTTAPTNNVANQSATLATSASLPPPRPPPPEIPKSPPKWPLRPGVLVHVKVDTKQNLCASRTQSPNTSLLSATNTIGFASPILNSSSRSQSIPMAKASTGTATAAVTNTMENSTLSQNRTPVLPVKQQIGEIATDHKNQTALANGRSPNVMNGTNGKKSFLNGDLDVNENANNNNDVSSVGLIEQSTTNNNNNNNNQNINTNNDELVSFTTSNLIERILGRLRWRRERSKPSSTGNVGTGGNGGNGGNGGGIGAAGHNSSGGSQHSEEGLFSRSNKRAVNLLRSTGWFGSGKSTNSSTGLMFDKRHHISGITCSDGGKKKFNHVSATFTHTHTK